MNTVLSRLMLLMFLAAFGRGITAPWINLYLSESGLSGTLIGVVLGIAALVELVATPLLNSVADHYQRHRLLHIAQLVMYALCCLALAVITNVWGLAVVIVFVELGKRPAIVLGLQLALTRLQELNEEKVGRIRASTAVGFAGANFLVTWVFAIGQYAAMFLVGAVFTLAALWPTSALPKHTERTTDQSIKQLPRNRGLYYLMAAQFFVMLGLRAGFSFWVIHFEDNLGLEVSSISILLAVMALLEVPFFLVFDRVLRRYDVRKIYIVGVSGMALMWVFIAIITNAVWIIPILVMRGFVFALFHLSILILIARISFPANVATNQALLQITIPGIAILFGGPLMGWVYDNLGAMIFFGLCAVYMFIGAGITMFAYKRLRRPEVALA